MQLLSVVDVEESGILKRNDVALVQVQVEVISLGRHVQIGCLCEGLAFVSGIEYVAPGSFGEIKLCVVLTKCKGVDSKFEGRPEHNVARNIIVSTGVIWEFKEHWVEEGASSIY